MRVKEPPKGLKRELVKYYFYTQQGLTLLNEFRYLVMGIFAMYFSLRLDNIWLIPIMFIVAVPLLMFFGWLSINHIQKIIDYFHIKRATTYGKYGYELNEKQLEALTKIVKLLEEKK